MKSSEYLDNSGRYKNIEVMQIFKNNEQILMLEGDEINGKTKVELCKEIGESRGKSELLTFSIKIKGHARQTNGRIRSYNPGMKTSEESNSVEFKLLSQKLSILEKNLNSGGLNNNGLVDIIKQSYEIRLTGKDEKIDDLKEKIDSLQDEIKELDIENESLFNKLQSVNNSEPNHSEVLFKAIDLLGKFKNPGQVKKINLKDDLLSNPETIPEQIKFMLGAVDWDKVTPDQLNVLANQFSVFADQLPLKYKIYDK